VIAGIDCDRTKFWFRDADMYGGGGLTRLAIDKATRLHWPKLAAA